MYVSPPDDQSRRQIFELELRKMPLEADVSLDELVDSSAGFSGAEVVAVCTEAAMLAIDERREFLSHRHLMTALAKIQPQITADMLAFYHTFQQHQP